MSYTEAHYVTQNGNGLRTGRNLANAWSIADFNYAPNWSTYNSADGKIGPGDVVYFSGTITSALAPKGSGTSGNPITLDGYESGSCDPITNGSCGGATVSGGLTPTQVFNYLTFQDLNITTNGWLFSIISSSSYTNLKFLRNNFDSASSYHLVAPDYAAPNNPASYWWFEGNRFGNYAVSGNPSGGINLSRINHLVLRGNYFTGDNGVADSSNKLEFHQCSNILVEYNRSDCYVNPNGAANTGTWAFKEHGNQNVIVRFNKFQTREERALGINHPWTIWFFVYGNYFYQSESSYKGGELRATYAMDVFDGAKNVNIWSNVFNSHNHAGILTWYRGGSAPYDGAHVENLKIYNNTFYNNGGRIYSNPAATGIGFTDGGQTGVIVKNNILVNNRPTQGDRIQVYNPTGYNLDLEHNTYYHSTGAPAVYHDGASKSVSDLQSDYGMEDDAPAGVVASPGLNIESNLTLNGTHIDNGADLSGLAGSLTIHGTTYDMYWQTALHPDTDWDGQPSSEKIITADQSAYGDGWDRGAYVYTDGTTPSVEIPKTNWVLEYVDSEETTGEDGAATNVFDSSTSTYWHTQWQGAQPDHPHEIQIDLGSEYLISELKMTPRQDGSNNGFIKDYEWYISNNPASWGSAVATGEFAFTSTTKTTTLSPAVSGRYIRLRSTSGWTGDDGSVFACVAEIGAVGEAVVDTSYGYDPRGDVIGYDPLDETEIDIKTVGVGATGDFTSEIVFTETPFGFHAWRLSHTGGAGRLIYFNETSSSDEIDSTILFKSSSVSSRVWPGVRVGPYADTSQGYFGGVQTSTDGRASYMLSGLLYTILDTPHGINANKWIWAKTHAVGSTISISLWEYGDTEPVTPQLTFEDSLFPTGMAGMYLYLAAGETVDIAWVSCSTGGEPYPLPTIWTVKESGGDYSSLALATANVSLDPGDIIEISGAWTADDTSPATISDANITVWAKGEARHKGYTVASPSHWRLRTSSGSRAISCSVSDGVILDGLDIAYNGGAAGEYRSVVGCSTASGHFRVKDCLIYRTSADVGQFLGGISLIGFSAGGIITVENTIVWGCTNNSIYVEPQAQTVEVQINSVTVYNGGRGLFLDAWSDPAGVLTCKVFNSVIIGNTTDIQTPTGTVTYDIHNCITGDATTAVDTSAYGCLSSRTETDNTSPGVGDWVVFRDITSAIPDLRLAHGPENDAIDMHSDSSGAGLTLPEYDIVGNLRSTDDIDCGAFDAQDQIIALNIATGRPEFSTPTIGQVHILTASDIVSGVAIVSAPTIGLSGGHFLSATDITAGVPVLLSPGIGQVHVLSGMDILTGTPLMYAPYIIAGDLVGEDILTGAAILSVPEIGQIHALTSTNITTGAPVLKSPRTEITTTPNTRTVTVAAQPRTITRT